MTEGRLEVESKSQECLVIIKREFTSNNLPKRRVLSSTHGVVGGRRLATASYPIFVYLLKIGSKLWKEQPVFWKEQGDFEHFGVFEPLKSVLSVII